GGEWPERGGEPGVEHVGVLPELAAAALTAGLRLVNRGEGVTVGAVVDGDPVAQPDLAADAPVPYVPQPVQVGALVALGVPAHLPALAGRDRAGRQLVHLQEPLLGDQRLDHRAAAVAVAD